MMWSSTKAKVIFVILCWLGVLGMLISMYATNQLRESWYAIAPLMLASLIGLFPSEKQVRAGITKDSIKAEFGIAEVRSDLGTICENTIVNGNKVFRLVESDGGYTYKTIHKMVARHADDVYKKTILIRTEKPDLFCGRGVAYPYFGLYVETGQKVS